VKSDTLSIIKGRHILRGDSYEEAWTAYCTDAQWAVISKEMLNSRQYRIRHEEVTYRTINHWAELGIIPEMREEEGKGWRKFSIVDLTWIHVVNELRHFGVALDAIRRMRSTLFEEKDGYPVFEIYIARGMKDPAYIVVFDDAQAELATKSELEHTAGWLLDDHIRISLNTAFEKAMGMYGNERYGNFSELLGLDAEELRAITLMRQGGYESIIIKFENGKIAHFELEEEVNPERAIIDLLKEHKYQSIELKKQQGKVVSIKRKVHLHSVSKATENLRASSYKSSRLSKISEPRAESFTCLPSKNAENI
jgi:DNA-binding transcriptional MerR regulator